MRLRTRRSVERNMLGQIKTALLRYPLIVSSALLLGVLVYLYIEVAP